jgi:hypothetical protein
MYSVYLFRDYAVPIAYTLSYLRTQPFPKKKAVGHRIYGLSTEINSVGPDEPLVSQFRMQYMGGKEPGG